MQHGFADDEMRAGARKFTVGLMVPALRAANIDLTNMPAVREALIAARFGDNLINACAEPAAIEARRPAPEWAPVRVEARSPQEQALFVAFGEKLIERSVALSDQAAVRAVIDAAGFRPDTAGRIAAGAAQAAMQVVAYAA